MLARRSAGTRAGARLSHGARRDGGNEYVPMNVATRRRRAWSFKWVVQDPQVGDPRKVPQAPSERLSGPAPSTKLVEEEPTDAAKNPIVVWFRDPPIPIQSEADESLGGDGSTKQLIGTFHQRVLRAKDAVSTGHAEPHR